MVKPFYCQCSPWYERIVCLQKVIRDVRVRTNNCTFFGSLEKFENMASRHLSKAYLNDHEAIVIQTLDVTTLILSSALSFNEIDALERFTELDQTVGKGTLAAYKG